MIEKTNKKDWPLFRMIIPAFPEVNIFTGQAKKTTALGPIMVATIANKLWGWRVEVIDENNYKGPRNSQGLPDHLTLQKENPATVVGFYCGLTSTIERVWDLAEFYHQEKVTTVAGGWHARYCPEETLKHDIDIVVHGDGEPVIQQILNVLQKDGSLEDIPGISFMKNGQMVSNLPEALETSDLNNLPYPDFGLLKYAKINIYPIGRIRGCGMNCEFCSVKGKPRWASANHLFNTVKWLVETRKARHFFIVDDRSEEDLDGTVEFFRLISEKYGNRLHFTVQTRLEIARNTELLEIMKKAGVRVACIGYESPIDEDLRGMHKGYSYSQMLEWTKILRRYFWIHAMFIVGYPLKRMPNLIGAEEIVRRFKGFIRKASPDTIQISLPVPFVGTALRQRLEKEGKISPLELVPWSRYDGSHPCFKPDNMSVRELQEVALKLMSRFYNPWSFIRIPLKTIVFPIDYFIRGWKYWYRGWYRDVIKYGGHRLLQQWRKKQKDSKFVERLEKY
ncbi:MAG: hypothetical protein COU42_00375 [Candidatus Nealsonbacteria bacterium CG10_big_fil_rev_8_21_14_0_10_36_24]|uniref:B12-binding domain-containing protein n=2 Tax=Candidatus Nealsoniibacteriota TaxID=1817911 RepID=A0A2H0YPG9_9BACT|nr:MAG: hypothetical protein COU42_00375 [Candidatus Nealsonbacteria bacterium CG10_big_fil_rev_8_21_14_0_10_36_24]PIS40179.1 MAG: hypothetical protein COT32_01135 [Candidatus Nealsonbacteria bacterium CG08_land_8_20_14_0_20_36_22]